MSPSTSLRRSPAKARSAHPEDEPLSLQLRAETEAAHRATEASVGLPGTIAGRDEYRACLIRFLRLYRPLEGRLHDFSDWARWGIDLHVRGHAARLVEDLSRLGVRAQDVTDAPNEAMPARTWADEAAA